MTMRKLLLTVSAVLSLGMTLRIAPMAAAGPIEIESFSAGMSDPQAGGHPDYQVSFRLATEPAPGPAGSEFGFSVVRGGAPKDVVVDLPAGAFGNPRNIPQCTLRQISESGCPAATQIGFASISTLLFGSIAEEPNPVYNIVPDRGEIARLGFRVSGAINSFIGVSLRPDGEYALRTSTSNIFDGRPLVGIDLTVWGSPYDPIHNPQRVCEFTFGCSYEGELVPFFVAPSDCGSGGSATLMVRPYQQPDESGWSVARSEPQAPTGCDRLAFEPSLDVQPTTSLPASPTGLAVGLDFPQHFDDPGGVESPPLRDVRVQLPAGMSLNPAAAEGLQACTDAQLGFGDGSPVACPGSSKVGTATAQSPVLDEQLQGSLYVRPQVSDDPASGDMFRLALVLEIPERGVLIKLAGQAIVDPASGRIETRFLDNPQLPVSSLDLRLKSGPRALLLAPSRCGSYETTATMTSWASRLPVPLSSHFTIDANCDSASRFQPGFQAGTTNPAAGGYSPFALRVTRADGEQNVSRVQAALAPGLLAKLAGVPLCGDAQAASGQCPAQSQVGTATVGVGGGSNPLYVPQPGRPAASAFLAGPYQGAPYSLVVEVPAQAGPFNLGMVTVRNKVEVDPVTTQVRVSSDPLPQIVGGIPVSYRDIRVDITRPEFTLNPTSCEPLKVEGSIVSVAGAAAKVSSRFQAADCERLGFKPRLALSLSGVTRRAGHPALKATLTMPKGGANIARARVTLPKTEFLENAHIGTICTRVQYAAKACPPKSVYGYAKAWSPLLDKPLQGPVYLRSSSHQLPDLVASLDGQIHVDLSGRIDAVDARIRNTFDFVPDAPVSRFVLSMQGGKKGLLANNTDICKTVPRANVMFEGQNGKRAESSPAVRTDCGRKRKGS
jgi:hypothetical protein